MKQFRVWVVGLMALCAPAVAYAAGRASPVPMSSAHTLEFKGAELGMTLASWKASPFPGAATEPVSTICSDEPNAGGFGLTASPAEQHEGVIACTYVSKAAGSNVREAVPLNDQILASQVVYRFEAGRLIGISYQTSVDAFDNVVARVKAQAGAPSNIQRDVINTKWGIALPRVRMRWNTPGASALITDPSDRPDRLRVTLTRTAPAG